MAITPVPPDQPLTGWAAWFRDLARAINALVSWSNLPSLAPTPFGALPTQPVAGTLAYIIDSSVTTGPVIGGGANSVLAWYNGTDWVVI